MSILFLMKIGRLEFGDGSILIFYFLILIIFSQNIVR